MSHDTEYYTYIYGYDSLSTLYYPALDSDGDGIVELYGSPANACVRCSFRLKLYVMDLWERSPYGSGSSR